MILIAIIIAIIGLYVFYKYPDSLAILFFTLTIADVNFKIGGLPLNFRAIIGILAFIRVLTIDKDYDYPSFFKSSTKYIPVFIIYTLLVTAAFDLMTFEFVKSCAITFICVYLGYFYYFKSDNASVLKISLILAGLICFADLAYTYIYVGHFPVQRIYQRLLDIPLVYDEYGEVVEPVNWGFYGCICGMAFLYILTDYINHNKSEKLSLLLLPIMFMGVIMSTSRSSLLGMIGASIFLIGKELKDRTRAKRAYKLILLSVGMIVLSLFLFSIMEEYLNLEVEFIEKISSRLIDEPIAVLNKNLGNSYNAQELDALDWRGEISQVSYEAFLSLSFIEQLFGIGFWGFTIRNLGHNNLPPHNGLLMLLIEYGIIGSCIWAFIFFTSIKDSIKYNDSTSPLLTILLFLFLYCLGQNEVLTQGLFFLIIATMIAENRSLRDKQYSLE